MTTTDLPTVVIDGHTLTYADTGESWFIHDVTRRRRGLLVRAVVELREQQHTGQDHDRRDDGEHDDLLRDGHAHLTHSQMATRAAVAERAARTHQRSRRRAKSGW
jgi:hypothetical protein